MNFYISLQASWRQFLRNHICIKIKFLSKIFFKFLRFRARYHVVSIFCFEFWHGSLILEKHNFYNKHPFLYQKFLQQLCFKKPRYECYQFTRKKRSIFYALMFKFLMVICYFRIESRIYLF